MSDYREDQEDVIDLTILIRNFFVGIWRFWWLVVLFCLIGAVVMYGKAAKLYHPMYRSEASFTVMTGSGAAGESYNFYYDIQSAGQLARTFPYILGSSLLTDAIEEDLGVEYVNGSISAQAVSDSNLITMTVVSADPQDAKDILESAIRVYPEVARFVIGPTKFNMIDLPSVPETPYNRPSYRRNVEYGMLGGLAAGVVFLGLYALLKKTVQRPEELDNVLNLSCLAQVPRIRIRSSWKKYQGGGLSWNNPHLPQVYRENIQGLLLKIQRELSQGDKKILLVTSTRTGEGKSTLAMGLAWAAAKHGQKVLLVDADLRKQNAGHMLGCQKGIGLSELVEGKSTLEEAAEPLDQNLYFLGGSQPAEQVSKVLHSQKLGELIQEMEKNYDLILLDAPPVEIFEDASVFCQYSAACLYVIRHDYVQKWRILDMISSLQGSGAQILGYVFNEIPRGGNGYGYGYGYGYGEKKKKAQEGGEGS